MVLVQVPAQVTLNKTQIDDARGEVTGEINADVQDGNTHASDEDTRDKAYSAAQLAFLQQADPEIAADEEAETSKSADDTNQAAQDEAAAIKKVDAATEQEVDDLVPAGQTMVDKEANADKTFVKAEVDAAVDAANTAAANTATTVAAEPDSDFQDAQTIGAPGIYIDVSGIHASFLLPLIDDTGKLTGYKFFSYWDASWNPGDSGGHAFNIFGYIGFRQAFVQTKIKDATFNPEEKFDYFVPTTMTGLTNMLNYAQRIEHGMGSWWFGSQYYSVLDGRTCVGFVLDTMDEADLWPLGAGWYWPGMTLATQLMTRIPSTIRLPNANIWEYAVPPPY